MQPTLLTYMADQQKRIDNACVLAVQQGEKTSVILDQTIFYPQGGGQAWDTGKITSPSSVFDVLEVRFAEGLVHHYGVFTGEPFLIGAKVECRIDESRRRLNSRLHSAGHLLDEAVKNLRLSWVPTKGIHFSGQTAVEYAGELGDASVEMIQAKLQAEIERLIAADITIRPMFVDVAELPKHAYFVPPNLPEGKPVRVVTMGGEKGTPCGGTHVESTGAIGALTVRYIKAKKGNIKIAYTIPNEVPLQAINDAATEA